MARSPRSGHRRLLLVLALAVVLLLALHASPAAAEDAAGGGSGSKPKGRADLPFWPPTQQDAAGILLIGLGLLIAAGGGIGGGGESWMLAWIGLVGVLLSDLTTDRVSRAPKLHRYN